MTIALGRGLSGLLRTHTRARSVEAVPADRSVPRWALVSAGLLPVLLTTGWLTAQALQPASYSPVRQTVSVMAGHGGAHRWIVTGALYLVGVGYLVTAMGLRALGALARFGLALSGMAAFAVASFPQPVHGTSTPHVLATVVGAFALAAWPVLVARPGSPTRAALGARLSTAAAAVSLGLLAWLAVQTRDGTVLGLAERLASSLQICCPFIVAFALSRRRDLPAGLPARRYARSPAERDDDNEWPGVLDRGVDPLGDTQRAPDLRRDQQPQQHADEHRRDELTAADVEQ
jgi:hypothetical protein